MQNTSYGGNRLNDNILLLIFSLPYLYDFAVGIVTIVLMSRIANFNGELARIQHEDDESKRRLIENQVSALNEKYSYQYLQDEFNRRESNSQGIVIHLINFIRINV